MIGVLLIFIYCKAFAIDTLSDKMAFELLAHFTTQKAPRSLTGVVEKPVGYEHLQSTIFAERKAKSITKDLKELLESVEREESSCYAYVPLIDKEEPKDSVRVQLRGVLISKMTSFVQQYDAVCAGFCDRLNTALLKVDTVNQEYSRKHDRRILLIQEEDEDRKSCGVIVLLPKGFEASISSKVIKRLFYPIQYDNSDFAKLLMICLFCHQADSELQPISHYTPLNAPVRAFADIIRSIDSDNVRSSFSHRLDYFWSKIPGVKFLDSVFEC